MHENNNNKEISFMEYTLAIAKLSIFHEMRNHNCLDSLRILLQLLLKDCSEIEKVEAYYKLVNSLLVESEEAIYPVGSLWQNYILEQILISDNIFTRQAESQEEISSLIGTVVNEDLRQLKTLYSIDWQKVEENVFGGPLEQSIFKIEGTMSRSQRVFPKIYQQEKHLLKKTLHKNHEWENLLSDIILFFKKWGTGEIAQYWVFKYNGEYLEGISKPDPIRLKELLGWDSQRNQIIDNTQQFVNGHTANNTLLYGDRGTGKSSTVKGLIYEFGEKGLRLIDVSLNGLVKLPNLLRKLSEKPQRFIIFIDDLSFEEYETQYKELKAVLEGGVEVQPDNVLIYATSNRRHLVKEKFSDKDMNYYSTENEEVRGQDSLQEKLSLSDRFGMTIYFTSPAQKEYLEIVRFLAKQRGIEMEERLLDRMALQWELMQNSRSGRTAKQFIDHLAGRLAMERKD
ncbi:MAG: hypothetical protein APF76_17345 [Desulfitibacter sp. BRH_c19]|nr:MAG: hypothetical protein APF76_17345 [Desulfitibacter sp. BRH_c19]